MEGNNKKVLIAVGLVALSFIVAIVLNMTGFKSVHIEPGKPTHGGTPAGNAGSGAR